MSVWANCSLKISDLELESWLLCDVLSVKHPGWELKRGGFVQSHLLCPSVCLEPGRQQLGMGCGFIHLNTAAVLKSWAGDGEQGKWSDSAKSQLCPSVRCGEEASLFPIASSSLLVHHCSFSQLFSPSGMLHFCATWEFPLWYSLILTLYLQKHWMPSSSSMLRELLCFLRKYLGFFFLLLYVAVQEIGAFGKPKLPGASPLLCSYF